MFQYGVVLNKILMLGVAFRIKCARVCVKERGSERKICTIQCSISPAQHPPNWYRSDILRHSFLGLFYSLSFILKTGCTDPGIIPRARPDEIDYMISLGVCG